MKSRKKAEPATTTIVLNGREATVRDNTSVMEALDAIGIRIPRMCRMSHPACKPTGRCRVCMVDVNGKLTSACTQPIAKGITIATHTERVLAARKSAVEFLFMAHGGDCQQCELHGTCELLQLAREVGVVNRTWPSEPHEAHPLVTMPGFVRDEDLCLLCGRCVQTCSDIQTVHALSIVGRGHRSRVAFDTDLCVNCGQCIHACPVAALRDNPTWVDQTRRALSDPTKHVVLQIAPAVRVALGEEFGMPPGVNIIGKLYAAARMLGFDMIGDTNFTADLTILEEGTELITRITKGGVLPQITTCSPGWIKFLEQEYPDLIPHASTCKSPQQMFGALAKTYYAKERGIDPTRIVVVSVMPCTAKHFEAARPEMTASGERDVDYVLTTREFGRMIREAGIDLPALSDQNADSILGTYTGAGTIFGTTGGVMEAALRTAYEVITGTTLAKVDFKPLRTFDGIKEATVMVGELPVRVAVAHGLGNARVLLDQIRNGKSPYHFIEIMTCPGGCVGGGGQPRTFVMQRREMRAKGLFSEDKSLPLRKSHDNPDVKAIYENFLGAPNSHLAHELLHTTYINRRKS